MPYTVLLVDDEPNVRSSLRRSLRGEGYDFVEASNPEEAIEILKQRKVDVVISDLTMPGMGGLEFIKIVRFRWPDCVRLILTGHADLEAAIQAINDGSVHHFLRKPWDTVDVKVMIRLCLRRLDATRENERLLATLRTTQPRRGAATIAVPPPEAAPGTRDADDPVPIASDDDSEPAVPALAVAAW
ncbi:MAG: response regulator [Deltaproteobacteria bacterium]|nr:response regulator [Deltaproteobacteria bacterium]